MGEEGWRENTRAAIRSTCQLLLFSAASDADDLDTSSTLLLDLVGNNWNKLVMGNYSPQQRNSSTVTETISEEYYLSAKMLF